MNILGNPMGAIVKEKLRPLSMIAALLLIWFVFNYRTEGAFLQARNISNLLRQMSVTGVLSVGMVLVIVAGQVDLSVGSVVAFLGGLLALLTTQYHFDPGAAFLIVVAAGMGIGCIQGSLVSFQKVPAFIVTLGGMMVFRGASMWLLQNNTIPLPEGVIRQIGISYLGPQGGWVLTGVACLCIVYQLFSERLSQKKFGLSVGSIFSLCVKSVIYSGIICASVAFLMSYQGIPLPVLILLGLTLMIYFFSTQTPWGRHVYAIGGNPEAAFLSGISVGRTMLSTFVLMGFLSAVSATILTARVGSASPDAGQLLELDAIAACVIGGTSLMGGRGSVFGAILGALIMESLNNGMSMENMEPYWQFIVKGFVLVGAVWMDVASRKNA